MTFPSTRMTLLSKLKHPEDSPMWQASWKRFLELYHGPIKSTALASYKKHTNGHLPQSGFIEDAVANTVYDLFRGALQTYDRSKASLRTHIRTVTDRRVVDLLRKEKPIDHQPLAETKPSALPPVESKLEKESFMTSLLATMIEDLRASIPMRQFEVFELVKLKHQSPDDVAEEFGITRAMVDRNVYKAMTKLRQLAQQPEYAEEFAD
ncbi:MAG: RNA polymerase sigma factor (sigma-70 family) [Gammaproteobacteria bacterium]|jgi:RNA polymerase sigma factor (sigma-70 family)